MATDQQRIAELEKDVIMLKRQIKAIVDTMKLKDPEFENTYRLVQLSM